MFSKAIKISTFIVCTIIFASLVYLLIFSSHGDKLTLFFEMENDTKVISSSNEQIAALFFLFGAPTMLFFAFMMRAIDWHHKKREGGYIWILGAILAFVSFMVMPLLVELSDNNPKAILGVFLIVEYIVHLLAVFVKQTEGGSYRSKTLKDFEDPDSWGCM